MSEIGEFFVMILGLSTELDAVASHSEIVPDTVIFDDFEKLVVWFLIWFVSSYLSDFHFDVFIYLLFLDL